MKNRRPIIIVSLIVALAMTIFAGCQAAGPGTSLSEGGTLILSVNPEIAIEYDTDGNVTSVEARNDDAQPIVAGLSDLQGQPARQVITELVQAIGNAGYFVEEIEGQPRQIVIEIESGSSLPTDAFLDQIAGDVEDLVRDNQWNGVVDVDGDTDYGNTDYDDPTDGNTDYGNSDYNDPTDGNTDYGNTDYDDPTDGTTDYGNTDYNDPTDGNTDYGNTDYNDPTDGTTDYGNTDYNDPTDGTTDYGDSDYDDADDGTTDYDDTDYGNTDYDDTDYGSGT